MFGYKKGYKNGFKDGQEAVQDSAKKDICEPPSYLNDKERNIWHQGFDACSGWIDSLGSVCSQDYLDHLRRRAYHEGYKQGHFDEHMDRLNARDTQIAKLERQEHCPYCHDPFKEKDFGKAILMTSHGSVRFSVTRTVDAHVPAFLFRFKELFSGCETRKLVSCKYCPECGRELGDDSNE